MLASSGRCLTGATQRAFVGHCAGRRPEVKPWLVVWTGNFEALSLSEPESRPGSNVLVKMQRRATEAEAGRDRKAADR